MVWPTPVHKAPFVLTCSEIIRLLGHPLGAASVYSHFSSMDSLGNQNVPWYFGQFVLEQTGCIYSVSGQSGV